MKRADGTGEVKRGWKLRLLGFRVIESSERHLVIRCPIWMSESAVERVAGTLTRETALEDMAHDLTFRTAGRVIRIDRELAS